MAGIDDVGTLHHRDLLALIWACFGTAFLFMSLRTYVRIKLSAALTAEDYWMFFALASLLALCVLETIQLPSLYFMTGTLSGDIPMSFDIIKQSEEYLRYEFPIVVLFWTVLWSVKAAFLALYYKLFKDLPVYRRVWYGLAIFTFLGYVGCWITLTLSCGNVDNFFGLYTCNSERDIWASNVSVYYSTVIDVFTDLCIMAMPLRLIYNVKVSMKQKLGLVAVFGLCFVMIAFSIIRANQILVPKMFVNLILLVVWSTLSASAAVVVGSLPAFKLFLNNRSAEKRTRQGSSAGGMGQKGQSGASQRSQRSRAIRLGSVASTDINSINKSNISKPRFRDPGDSQDDIMRPVSNATTCVSNPPVVMVKHDVQSVTYDPNHQWNPSYETRNYPDRSHYGRAV